MNNDLISREALKKKIQEIVETEMPIDEKWAMGLRYSLKLIDNAPTVEPKQGEWSIDNRPNIGGLWKCSECNDHYPYKTKFCPNCGSKMKGGAVK